MAKNAIVLLTKGYNNTTGYNLLVNRNRYISQNFYLKQKNPTDYDILIFHEGNITLEDQQYIQSGTPKLPLKFIYVKFNEILITNRSLCPPTNVSIQFSMGYKNMCYFWSISFLYYLKNYEYIIRVDEDCKLINIPIDIIEDYKNNNIVFSSAYFQGEDDKEVTLGLKETFDCFMSYNNIQPYKNEIRCPYTNFSIINVQYFNNNELICKVLSKIRACNCIFSNRWGDLPIWGYILSYLVDPNLYIEDKNISYYHGSHNKRIN
jgi:hypothetical protein